MFVMRTEQRWFQSRATAPHYNSFCSQLIRRIRCSIVQSENVNPIPTNLFLVDTYGASCGCYLCATACRPGGTSNASLLATGIAAVMYVCEIRSCHVKWSSSHSAQRKPSMRVTPESAYPKLRHKSCRVSGSVPSRRTIVKPFSCIPGVAPANVVNRKKYCEYNKKNVVAYTIASTF